MVSLRDNWDGELYLYLLAGRAERITSLGLDTCFRRLEIVGFL